MKYTALTLETLVRFESQIPAETLESLTKEQEERIEHAAYCANMRRIGETAEEAESSAWAWFCHLLDDVYKMGFNLSGSNTAFQASHVKHEEYTLNGRRVILDTAELFPGSYETMLLRRSDGREIASMRAATEAEALAHFSVIRAAYPPDKPKAKRAPGALTGRYAKLRDDLKKALEAGRAAEDANPEDGGTCNFDSAALSLPRWTAEKVKQAAKEAGTSCFVWNCYGSKQFVFGPDSRAQANARSRNAEAMTRALCSMGYDAMDYCQMD